MKKMPLRPDARAFLDWLDRHPGPRMHEVGPEEARRMDRRMHLRWAGPVGAIAEMRDLDLPIPVRRFDAAPGSGTRPALVFFHGGGFVVGSIDTHAALCAELARLTGLPVFAVDYRLAPEHPWPAAPDDCEAAARRIAREPGVDGLVLAGDSAGGMLAIVTAIALRDDPAAVPVRALWPIYPAIGPGTRYPSFESYGEEHYLTRADLAWFFAQYAANIRHWRANPLRVTQAGLPPTIILTAQCDPLADQGRAYAEACRAAGVEIHFREAEGAIHGFASLRAAMPSADIDLRWCAEQLKDMLRT